MNHKVYLLKTKMIFSTALMALVTAVVGFSIFLRGFFYIYEESKIALAAFNYKVDYARFNNQELLASVFSALNDRPEKKAPAQSVNGNADSLPVLVYHGIVKKPNGTDVTLETFREQMFALKKAGYQTVTSADFLEFVNGRKKLPAKSFLLTFDDGRKNSYYPVDPILKALDYSAVMFVVTRYSLVKESGPFYLSLAELKNMVKSGRWEMQVHTRDGHTFYSVDANGLPGHFYGDKLWRFQDNRLETDEEFRNRIADDFLAAYKDMKNLLGISATMFAYPFGDYGHISRNFPDAEKVVKYETSRVYPAAFYQTWIGEGFTTNFPNPDQYLKKRLDVRPHWTADYLLSMLQSGEKKSLPYSDSFTAPEKNNWITMLGTGDFSESDLVLRATEANDSGGTLLN